LESGALPRFAHEVVESRYRSASSKNAEPHGQLAVSLDLGNGTAVCYRLFVSGAISRPPIRWCGGERCTLLDFWPTPTLASLVAGQKDPGVLDALDLPAAPAQALDTTINFDILIR